MKTAQLSWSLSDLRLTAWFLPFFLLLRGQNTYAAHLHSAFAALHRKKIIKNRLKALKSDRLLDPLPPCAYLYPNAFLREGFRSRPAVTVRNPEKVFCRVPSTGIQTDPGDSVQFRNRQCKSGWERWHHAWILRSVSTLPVFPPKEFVGLKFLRWFFAPFPCFRAVKMLTQPSCASLLPQITSQVPIHRLQEVDFLGEETCVSPVF